MRRNSAVFLDRDGVIIQNRSEYVRSWEEVRFLPGSLDAMRELASFPYHIVIVTNQSAVGRGLLDLQTAHSINARIVAKIKEHSGRVDSVEMCPHKPEDHCECRKPKPGMLLRAQKALNLDLHTSILIGDSSTDLYAGAAAGVRNLVLVRTGLGETHESLLPETNSPRYQVYDNLAQVVTSLASQLSADPGWKRKSRR